MKEILVWLALIAFLYFAWTSPKRHTSLPIVPVDTNSIPLDNTNN